MKRHLGRLRPVRVGAGTLLASLALVGCHGESDGDAATHEEALHWPGEAGASFGEGWATQPHHTYTFGDMELCMTGDQPVTVTGVEPQHATPGLRLIAYSGRPIVGSREVGDATTTLEKEGFPASSSPTRLTTRREAC